MKHFLAGGFANVRAEIKPGYGRIIAPNHFPIDHRQFVYGLSLLTIALDTGFESIAPFNRAFKAQTGETPSESLKRTLAEPV